MQTLIATGNLCKDNELKYTSNKKEVLKNTLAVRRDKETSDFISFTCFGTTAKILNDYTHKGSKIAIEGEIRTGSYEKDGKKVYTQDIIVNRVELLENKKENAAPVEKKEEGEEVDPYELFAQDNTELPF